jgi:hypothetical protein
MKDYEDEAFDDIEKAQQRKVAHGVTDGNKKDAALMLAKRALSLLKLETVGWTSQEVDRVTEKALVAIDEALEDV